MVVFLNIFFVYKYVYDKIFPIKVRGFMQLVLVLSMCSSFHMCKMPILEEHNFIIFIMYLLNCMYCIKF